MSDFCILGTDTDAGKTTFALLWLAHFGDRFEYWKPVETGPSDSEAVARLLPTATVHPRGFGLTSPLAPPLAARLEGTTVPHSTDIAALRSIPTHERSLLIESFGSPFSPLNERELQIELLRTFNAPGLLVSSSKLGAVGRTLSALAALEAEGLLPFAVVLMGPVDTFAEEKIRQYRPSLTVVSLTPPTEWSPEGVREGAAKQAAKLDLVLNQLWNVEKASLQPSLEPTSRTGSAGDSHSRDPSVSVPNETPVRVATEGEAILHRDRSFVWHPYTPLIGADEPLVCLGAKDEFLHLADGRRIIDGISSWWTIQHGHQFPPLMATLREVSHEIDHVLFAGVTHPWACELAELMLASIPWNTGGRVFFSDNGSTAVEVALKLAYQFWCHARQPGRKRFVGFEHGYHGDTFGAMSVSRDPLFFGRFESHLFAADILPLDPNRLDEHLRKARHETAAIIVEPLVQGAGGMRMHSADTLRQLFEVARSHDVLFIADEVMTGGGRTGTLWAFEQAGITPDLVCAGKTLTGGILPLAATLVSPLIVDAFASENRTHTFYHGHSFTAHPLACAVARRNWHDMRSREFLSAPRSFETFWRTRFQGIMEWPTIRDVRVKGSIVAIEVDVEGGYLATVAASLRRHCLNLGVYLRPLGNVLYAMSPYCTSRESLERIAEAMESALRSVST